MADEEAKTLAPLPPRWLGGVRVPILRDPDRFEFTQRIARLYSESQLVPAHLRGKIADCFIALNMADTMDEDPLMVMQNIFIINGKAGWGAQYMIARANRSGMFKGPLRWRSEGTGDDLTVWCFADLAGVDDDPRIEIPVSMKMAKDDGWTRNDKYKSIPEQMLRWRSATWLIRLYCPEVMMGLPSADELVDTRGNIAAEWGGGMEDVTPSRPVAEEDQPRRRHRRKAEEAPAPNGQAGPEAPTALPFIFADVFGEIHEFVRVTDALEAYVPYLDAAQGNAAQLEAVWQNGSPLVTVMRQHGHDQEAHALTQHYERLVREAGTGGAPQGESQPGLSLNDERQPEPPPTDNPIEYDVVVPLPEGIPINQWHMYARQKLKDMHDAKRPPADFRRFREKNAAGLGRLSTELRSWHNMIAKEIDRGAAGTAS